MSIRIKRKLDAWLLLLVFVPILLMASLHRHESDGGARDTVCYSCLHHTPHPSHMSGSAASWHQCVLCQFNTLPYVQSAIAAFSFLSLPQPCIADAVTIHPSWQNEGANYLRAPPCTLL